MADKLRYLTISLYHPQILKGGAQYVAKDLHDAATADPSVEATLLSAFDAVEFPQYAKVGAALTALPDGTSEYLLPGTRFDDFYHIIYDPRRNKALRHFLKERRPDVIHIHHSIWVGLEILSLIRQTLPDCTILYTLHEYIPICHARGQLLRQNPRSICHDSAPDQCVQCFPHLTPEKFTLRRRNFQEAFALVDGFISPSEYLLNRFVEWGLPADRMLKIANGHTRRRPDSWTAKHSGDLNVFGFFGQYVDAKGIDVLLQAAAIAAKQKPVEIRVFGGNKQYATPSYVAQIEAILADAPEDLKVVEVGPYSRDNVFDLMASVDWVVVPSVWPETFALVVSEAWDAKRPVLASNVGGLTERIREDENGKLFVPGAIGQLSELMLDCIGNKRAWDGFAETITDEISTEQAWAEHVGFATEIMRRRQIDIAI